MARSRKSQFSEVNLMSLQNLKGNSANALKTALNIIL